MGDRGSPVPAGASPLSITLPERPGGDIARARRPAIGRGLPLDQSPTASATTEETCPGDVVGDSITVDDAEDRHLEPLPVRIGRLQEGPGAGDGRQPPVATSMIPCSVHSETGRAGLSVPRAMTARRSQMPISSGKYELTIRTALPCAASSPIIR
jgi:hypothetical protein